MNLLASSVKSASYDELYDLASFLVGTFGLNEDPDSFCIEPSEMAHRISQWSDVALGAEVKNK